MTEKKEERPQLKVVADNPEEVIELHQRWNNRTRKWENLDCPAGSHVIKDKK